MTATEMIPAVGQRVIVRCENLRVSCLVHDVKHRYGKPRLLVVPVAGGGSQWVELGRVLLEGPIPGTPAVAGPPPAVQSAQGPPPDQYDAILAARGYPVEELTAPITPARLREILPASGLQVDPAGFKEVSRG